MIAKLTFEPESLKSSVLKLRDNMMSAMETVDATSIHGFITSYGFLCDFFGVTFNEEISWVRSTKLIVNFQTESDKAAGNYYNSYCTSTFYSVISCWLHLQYMKNVYLEHGFRDLRLSDFDQLSGKSVYYMYMLKSGYEYIYNVPVRCRTLWG